MIKKTYRTFSAPENILEYSWNCLFCKIFWDQEHSSILTHEDHVLFRELSQVSAYQTILDQWLTHEAIFYSHSKKIDYI